MRHPLLPITALALCLPACQDDTTDEGIESMGTASQAAALTYHGQVRAILEEKCLACHTEGNIAPFPLTTHAEVYALRSLVEAAIVSGSMPPWQPADGCNEYAGDRSLSSTQRDTLLQWLAADAPEGDPADYVPPVADTVAGVRADVFLPLEEAYTPVGQPDDYRCFLLDWPAEQEQYITGFGLAPDRLDMVHHVLAYIVEPQDVETYEAMDAQHPGPGYECFGGPTAGDSNVRARPRQFGGWVPGATSGR